MRTHWKGRSIRHLHEARAKVGSVNVAIFELARLRDKLEREYLDAVGILLGKPGGKLLETHHFCPTAPMGKCLYEVVPDHADDCLFCGQPIMRDTEREKQ